jgi:hypothetical protein
MVFFSSHLSAIRDNWAQMRVKKVGIRNENYASSQHSNKELLQTSRQYWYMGVGHRLLDDCLKCRGKF